MTNFKKRKERERRVRHERTLLRQQLHQEGLKDRQARSEEIDKQLRLHPFFRLALHISPRRVGWCWRFKKVNGRELTWPVDFVRPKYFKPLMDWMKDQPWWDEKHPLFTELVGRRADGQLTEYQFNCEVVEMIFATVEGATPPIELASATRTPAQT